MNFPSASIKETPSFPAACQALRTFQVARHFSTAAAFHASRLKMNNSAALRTLKKKEEVKSSLWCLLISATPPSPVRSLPSSSHKGALHPKTCVVVVVVNKINPFTFTLLANQVILIQGGRRLPREGYFFLFVCLFIYSFPSSLTVCHF